MPSRRRLVARNLQRVSGGTLRGPGPAAGADTFDSYGRYWLELFRLPKDVRGPLAPGSTSTASSTSRPASPAGNGVILALPHVGGWDYAGAWLAAQGFPPTVVVEPVEPPELFEWFAGAREALGMTVVQLGPDAGRAVLGALRGNRVVCLLSDRDLTGDGVEVEFFGERTTLPGARPRSRCARALRSCRVRVLRGAGRPPGRAARRCRPSGGAPPRGRRARHPGHGPPLRGADPRRTRPVAPVAAELAQ